MKKQLIKSIPLLQVFAGFTWGTATVLAASVFFGLSVYWSYLDNSPPAWDQGLYLYQATLLHNALVQNGIHDFIVAVFNVDRGRVPLLPVLAQPAFFMFGPSLDAAVISLNFFWFVLGWAVFGIARELTPAREGGAAGFFAFVLFGICPLTTMLSHSYLVEFLLVSLVSAAIYSIWMLHKTGSRKWSVSSGVFIFLGLLTKVTFVAFVLPAFLYLVYRTIRNTSIRQTLGNILPIIMAAGGAGIYYIHNFRQIFEMTSLLSSHGMAQLYGFGGAFDPQAVLGYLRAVFGNPAMLMALFLAAAMFILSLRHSRGKIESADANLQIRMPTMLVFVWFAIPFLLATFGEIKDPRYIYPGLVPIFILAGIVGSRYFQNKIALVLLVLAYSIPLSGYLYCNNLLGEGPANQYRSFFGMAPVLASDAEARPDPRVWKVDALVRGVAGKLDALQANKTVLFLGGNRYHHINLLNYEGLTAGAQLTYTTLPYYFNPNMSLDEALKFIEDKDPTGILQKSGENWPPFSSRLDSAIVSQLHADPKYEAVDLNIEQPDGSRYTLFVKRPLKFVAINSSSDLTGSWKAGNGVASFASSGSELKITTETGSQSLASLQRGMVAVPNWNVNGRLTADAKYIHWSNGFIWERKSSLKIVATRQ